MRLPQQENKRINSELMYQKESGHNSNFDKTLTIFAFSDPDGFITSSIVKLLRFSLLNP